MNISPVIYQLQIATKTLSDQKESLEPNWELNTKCYAEMQKLLELAKKEKNTTSTQELRDVYKALIETGDIFTSKIEQAKRANFICEFVLSFFAPSWEIINAEKNRVLNACLPAFIKNWAKEKGPENRSDAKDRILNFLDSPLRRRLNLSNLSLKNLPDIFYGAVAERITHLDISRNHCNPLPETLKNLKDLEDFGLCHNNVKTLPEWICDFKLLKELSIEGNQIKSLPSNIGNLKALKDFRAPHNELESLPESMEKLQSLGHLDISKNKFTTLPEWIGKLSSLQMLFVSDNELVGLPKSLGNARNLELLFATGNPNLVDFPDEIFTLPSQCEIFLDESIFRDPSAKKLVSKITEQGYRGPRFFHLTQKNTSDKKQSNKPHFVEFTATTQCYNNVETLPEWICDFKLLKELSIEGNQIKSLPSNIGNLKALKDFKAPYNELESLPESMEKLQSLGRLDISNNKFTTLPEWIGKLSSLQMLFVSDNELVGLPKSLGNARNLELLFATGNPNLVDFPDEIFTLPSRCEIFLDESIFRDPGAKKLVSKITEQGYRGPRFFHLIQKNTSDTYSADEEPSNEPHFVEFSATTQQQITQEESNWTPLRIFPTSFPIAPHSVDKEKQD